LRAEPHVLFEPPLAAAVEVPDALPAHQAGRHPHEPDRADLDPIPVEPVFLRPDFRGAATKYPLEAKVVDNTLVPQAQITGDLLPTFK
jgi:hypothetical protein